MFVWLWFAVATLTLVSGASARTCGIFGVTVNSSVVLRQVEQKLGCTFAAVRWFQDWNTPFNQAYAREITARGQDLELSWQPRIRNARGQFTGVPYREIAQGKHDPYLRKFAREIWQVGTPINISFAPEMNGNWGVYQLGPSNTPADFVRAWQQLVRVFRSERAPVRWIWAVNIQFPDMKNSYRSLYPGDAWVDEVGLDGYNWGTTHSWNRWLSFQDTFGPSYQELKRLTTKPIQLGEVGSVEQGGDKARWIKEMCRDLPGFKRVRRAFWFHLKDGAVDWRITTSAASLEAFRKCTAR